MFKRLLESKSDVTEATTPLEETPNNGDAHDAPDDSMQALETLGKVVRVLGRHAFDVDQLNAQTIENNFERWARHVLIGMPLEESQQPQEEGENRRDWGGLNQFVNSHRQLEKNYVTNSLGDLRDALWMFTHTIGRAVVEDQGTDGQMNEQLGKLRAASDGRSPEEMRTALLSAVDGIGHLIQERTQRQRVRVERLGSKLREVEAELGNAKKQMKLDPLTQLYNRAALDMHLERVAGLCILSGSPATLLMVDVDHFKQVNDTYGHPAGDAVLRQLADLVVSVFPRKNDFIARYGGEELSVLLQGDGLDVGRRIGQRLLDTVRSKPFEYEGTPIPLTVSVGLAELILGETVVSWVERADRALYQAKHSGRDRLCEASEAKA